MKTDYSNLIFVCLIALACMAPIIAASFYMLKNIGEVGSNEKPKPQPKTPEQIYDEKYAEIQEQIRTFYVCPENKKLIYSLIYELEALPYKNEEKTYVLWQNAWERFKPVEKEEVIENMIEELETVR